MSDTVSTALCPRCSDTLVPNKPFCPTCGLPLPANSPASGMEAYIQARLSSELDVRLKGQESVVRELADKAEDALRRHFKNYATLAAVALSIIAGLLGFLGFKSFKDLEGSVENRIEPLVRSVEQRTKQARESVDSLNVQVGTVKTKLSSVADEAESQRKRIEGQGAEIKTKVSDLERQSEAAQRLSASFDKQATENSRRLQEIVERSNRQIADVTRRANNASLAEVYPNFGRENFIVTASSRPVRKSDKRPHEKWVNLILPITIQEKRALSLEQVEALTSDLEAAGFRVIPGELFVQGSAMSSVGRLSPNTNDETAEVTFFDPSFHAEAQTLVKLIAKFVPSISPTPLYVQVGDFQPWMRTRFSVFHETSGVDAGIYLGVKR